jgi:hypothetical protein
MTTERQPTEAEIAKGEVFQRIREWLTEWKKDDLVLLATILMVQNGLPDK